MSVLIKYPKQTKESNKVFFEKKNQELTNLDWAKWGGWWDTDGRCGRRVSGGRECELELKDRQPVELFSKTFECSLCSRKKKSTTPKRGNTAGKNYMITLFGSLLSGEKAKWFTQNVYPYLIKQEKKEYAVKLLGYSPESKDFADWIPDEVKNYIATAMDGDGHYNLGVYKMKYNCINGTLYSNDIQYLANVQNLLRDKLEVPSRLSESYTYETQEGTKTMYRLRTYGSWKKNISFFQDLVDHMTIDRKKQIVQEYLNDHLE